MELQRQEIVCTECFSTFNAIPKRSFLGFLKFVCPKCNKNVLYPLTSGYRTFYWILVVLMAIVFIGSIAMGGGIFAPNLLGIAVIIALVKDVSIKKKIQNYQNAKT